MRVGKHVYCQKPLTHDVVEARLMRSAAKKNKVCTQMGNQGTAANGLRRAVELIQAGVLGDVKEVHVWTNRPIWPQAPDVDASGPEGDAVPKARPLGRVPRPGADAALPGPSDKTRRTTRFDWRGWWDFGTGALGDMACHTANMAFMALKLGHPTQRRRPRPAT